MVSIALSQKAIHTFEVGSFAVFGATGTECSATEREDDSVEGFFATFGPMDFVVARGF